MSERGATNQAFEDWRARPADGSQIESILQHAINKNRAPKPDMRDGMDLLVIILIITVVCFIAGYLTGRH
jgi:hypothetical protein